MRPAAAAGVAAIDLRRLATLCGCTVVIVLCAGFVGLPLGITGGPVPMTWSPFDLRAFGQYLLFAEATLAIIFLLGLMWGDPGVVKRSPETCYPMPEVVSERLRNGRTLDGVGNVTEVCCGEPPASAPGLACPSADAAAGRRRA